MSKNIKTEAIGVTMKNIEEIDYSLEDVIEEEMVDALHHGDFQIYFQPKVNMLTSRLYGAEALSRWVHKRLGLIPPDKYIPLFEENGFIVLLDKYVFEKVCECKAQWKGTSYEHIIISVNMSRANLYVKNQIEKYVAVCEKYNVPTNELEIEITENMFVKDSQELVRFVKELKKAGFKVSIDDFGSGFSSLNMLKDVDVDVVKIDKGFLNLASDDYKGRTIIRSIIDMCKEIKMGVIAEGIETEEQIKFILECGCENAQGFYYSRPIPIKEFEVFADKYTYIINECIRFPFDKDLSSDDGRFVCEYNGEGYEYVEGPKKGMKALHFPGGGKEENTVIIPKEVFLSESYTIMFWTKLEEVETWTSILYVKYDFGFLAFNPIADNESCTYRIRDYRNVISWYDCEGEQLKAGVWTHIAFTYSAEEETTTLYINGEKVNKTKNVSTLRYPKRAVLGGDVYKNSYKGCISEFVAYYGEKKQEEIKDIYNTYLD